HAPAEGDIDAWCSLFLNEFADLPGVTHATFGWDAPDGEQGRAAEFVAAGFTLERANVLVSTALSDTARINGELDVRPIDGTKEWLRATEIQFRCAPSRYRSHAGYRAFLTKRMDGYRQMVRAGLGHWYGAFIEDAMVGGCGLFGAGNVARFQMIGTDPVFQHQGVCTTLLVESGRRALAEGARKLVIVAEAESSAEAVYRKAGFERHEVQLGLERAPGKPAAKAISPEE
ncbi:MAG: GNAT family N-acetyltransferase, partial [Myxococcales bacterium]|nr:GNAT family N-acetyltransferase [Myxococcales bacterium]